MPGKLILVIIILHGQQKNSLYSELITLIQSRITSNNQETMFLGIQVLGFFSTFQII